MKFIPEEGKRLHEDCSTLILPAVSIGNVGQLTADLFVSSMDSERVGYLDNPYVLPCVGNDAYGPLPQGDLALPLEVYDSPSNALTIIQQRSPVIKIYYLSSANNNGTDENCEQLGWKKLQEYDPSQTHWKYLIDLAEGNATREDIISLEDELEEENYYASLPFAALFSFLKAKGLKVTCLLCYCSEGDNISDAFQLADAACKLLKLSHPNSGIEGGKWQVPLSWMTVYGPPPDVSIF
ncbi:uncharacterized protein [Cicer arietinum]|uniref:Proteasome assembly chaperone 2 n=1 Tax=Cicer arietinum TaxID=3827 RepID=A0A1S3ECU4_CICAR|nr:proteasome assembly chaperone 2 isoform X2 [Cicer arietinum]